MEGGRTPIEEAISHAVLAGAYAALIREIPETARGFGRLYKKHHTAGAEAVRQICSEAGSAERTDLASRHIADTGLERRQTR